MRSMKSILGSSLLDQATDVGGGRPCATWTWSPATCATCKPGRAEAGRPLTRWCWAAGVLRRRRPERDARRRQHCDCGARAVGFARCSSSSSPSPPRWTTRARIDREQLVLVADIGGGTSDFSLVRVGPQRRGRADRRTTSWPTTACTSPAPTSTAMSSWPHPASCGYRAPPGRPAPGARCPAGLLRPGHLAPDQHRLRPRPGGRAAQHEELLCRAAPPCAADEGGGERLGHALAASAERPRSRWPTAARPHRPGSAGSRPAAPTLADGQAAAALDDRPGAHRAAARCHRWRQAGLAPRAGGRAVLHRRLSTGLKPLAAAHRGALSAGRTGARRPLCQRGAGAGPARAQA
jgi:hypothetical protein